MSAGRVIFPTAIAALVVTLTACTAGPDYVVPTLEVGDGWAAGDVSPEPVTAEDLGRFWERFQDPTLDRLVETALAQNLGVRQAAARVAEARALRDRTAGRELPTVATSGDVILLRQSENGPLPIATIPGLDRDQTIFEGGFDASWELDLAGRTRRAVEGAEARLESAQEEQRGAQFRIAAEITRTYLTLRGEQRRLAAVERAVHAVRQVADLVSLRVEAGEEPRLALWRVEADVYSLKARLPPLGASLRATAIALATLTGALPETELALLDESPGSFELAEFPLGERAALLARRPDLRAAERRLAAATADLGVATAELYPRLSIGARGGFQALEAGDLLESGSVTWSVLPKISWRVFDGGRVRAEIRLAEVRGQAAALAWEAAVLEALGDAEQALARYRGGLDALTAQQAAVAAAQHTRDLEEQRYTAGDTSLLALLDATRRLEEIEADLASTQTRAAGDLVALVKALGGGWAPSSSEAVGVGGGAESAQCEAGGS